MIYKSKKFEGKKTFRQLEKVMKGGANHRRLQIMALLEKEPELSLIEISKKTNANIKTIFNHVKYLESSGLVLKRSDYNFVRHKLTKNGDLMLKFLRMVE
ncbi:winged helix-turn-helix domain-containing protein [Patescibacteria group bacterium]|nr:winged helix-turn-helix domain-containing protein [Patescibacteria group bacterium]